MLPLAHAAHYLWVLYLPPLLIVVASIAWTKLSERRKARRGNGAPPDGA